MSKLYKKSDLSMVNGYIVDGENNLVSLPAKVYAQFCKLDAAIQKKAWETDMAAWLKQRPDDFELETREYVEILVPEYDPDPELAKFCEMHEGMLEMENEKHKAKLYAGVVADMPELFEFVGSEYFIPGEGEPQQWKPVIFDNPLGVTMDELSMAVCATVGIAEIRVAEEE